MTYVMDAARETVSNKERIQTNLLENALSQSEGADTLAALALTGIPAVQDHMRDIAQQGTGLLSDVIDWVDRGGREILYKVNLLPTPAPTPTAQPTPEPTPTPEQSPEPEETVQPEETQRAEPSAAPSAQPQSTGQSGGADQGEDGAEGVLPASAAEPSPSQGSQLTPSPAAKDAASPTPSAASRPAVSVTMPTVAPTATLPPPTPSPTPQPTPQSHADCPARSQVLRRRDGVLL